MKPLWNLFRCICEHILSFEVYIHLDQCLLSKSFVNGRYSQLWRPCLVTDTWRHQRWQFYNTGWCRRFIKSIIFVIFQFYCPNTVCLSKCHFIISRNSEMDRQTESIKTALWLVFVSWKYRKIQLPLQVQQEIISRALWKLYKKNIQIQDSVRLWRS